MVELLLKESLMVEWIVSPPNKNNMYPSALSAVADRLS